MWTENGELHRRPAAIVNMTHVIGVIRYVRDCSLFGVRRVCLTFLDMLAKAYMA